MSSTPSICQRWHAWNGGASRSGQGQNLAHGVGQLLDTYRLLEYGVYAVWLIARRRFVHPSRDDDDRHLVTAIPQQEQKIFAVGGSRHVQVEEDEIHIVLVEHLQRLSGIGCRQVADWYAPDYYAVSPISDPPGPADGGLRVARGGHFLALREAVTVTVRNAAQPNNPVPVLGFRCGRTESPP